MRSTGFVFLSILVHCLAVAAIAMHPQRISEMQGDTVEMTVGDEATQAGAADAPADVDTTGAPSEQPKEQPAPVPVVKETPAPQEPAVKETPQPKKVAAVAPVKKSAPVKKAAPAPAPAPVSDSQDAPEKLQPDVEEAVPVAAESEDKKVEEEVSKPEPVKETAAAGVAADQATEASSKEEAKAADPVAAAAPAGATQEINQLTEGGELGKGGATAAGAVEYTELRQMAGNKPPVYPLAARRERRQGETELLYRVQKDGTVTDVSVARSSGSEDLDNEAVRAVSKFRFVPGQEGWAKHPVQFNLKGDTAAMPSRLRTKVGAQE